MHCLICGYRKVKILYTFTISKKINDIENFRVIQCLKCGLVYLNPLPPIDELINKFYENGYYKKEENFLHKFLCYLNRKLAIKEIKNFKLKGRILDIGCGHGEFLRLMQENGYESYGIEPSREGYKICSKIKNLKIYNCKLMDCKFNDLYFDVITMWHVLEHLPNPHSSLQKIKKMLKTDGILIIEVPNFSIEARMFKKYWYYLDIPRHTLFYNRKSLLYLLTLHNFKILRISSAPIFSFFLSPLRSYISYYKNNNNIFLSLILLFLVILLCIIKIFPIFHFRSCIRIYAKPN